MIKKLCNIVLATDGSEFSSGAENFALNLAQKCGAKLYIIYVILHNPEYDTIAPQEVETEISKAKEILQKVKQEATNRGLEVETDIILAEEIEKGIISGAEKYQANLIVMGRRGKRGLAKFFIGSATLGVLQLSQCPLLVAPRKAEFKGKGLLVCVDGTFPSLYALDVAAEIAFKTNLPIYIISIAKDIKEKELAEANIKKGIEHLLSKNLNLTIADQIVHIGDPAKIIIEVAKQRDVDIIVLGNRGLKGFTKMVLGSVSENVLSNTDRAVLIVKTLE
ncbi:MAG: universal stress protein [Caldimicrobium sp.]